MTRGRPRRGGAGVSGAAGPDDGPPSEGTVVCSADPSTLRLPSVTGTVSNGGEGVTSAPYLIAGTFNPGLLRRRLSSMRFAAPSP